MKRLIAGFICLLSLFGGARVALAEGCQSGGSKVLVTPVSKEIQIEPSKVVDESFTVKNQSERAAKFRIYAAPYTDTTDEDSFSTETAYTQISRWIKFFDVSGGQLDTLEINLPACSEREVTFRVKVPDSLPDGGQYAVIFVENKNESDAVITSTARVGMLLYGRVSGGTTIKDMSVADVTLTREMDKKLDRALIQGGVTVMNNGNVDSSVETMLTVRSILGREVYSKSETVTLLPGTPARKITNTWEETPTFGLFIAEYTVKTADGATETATQVFLIVPLPVLVMIVIALVVVVIGVIRLVRKVYKRQQKYNFR